jgi:photosystem II stability/assembly factor-like uncharacterized protein
MKRPLILSLLIFTAITLFPGSVKAQWVATNGPGPGGPESIYSLSFNGTYLFAGEAGPAGGAIYRSTDSGASWTAVNNGLPKIMPPSPFLPLIFTLVFNGTDIYAGTGSGVFRSTNNGAYWSAVNNGLTNVNVYALAVNGTNFFAGTRNGGVFRSTDSGGSWTAVNNGLTNLNIYVFAVSGTDLFAGTLGGGVFRSADSGASWTAVNNGLTNLSINTLAVNGTDLFAGTGGGGIFRSTDSGASWTAVNNGLTNMGIYFILASSSGLFASIDVNPPDGVFRSTDSGATWIAVNKGIDSGCSGCYPRRLAASGNSVFLGTDWQIVYRWQPSSGVLPYAPSLPITFFIAGPYGMVRYSLASACHVSLKYYDLRGRLVATLVNREQGPGSYTVRLKKGLAAYGTLVQVFEAGGMVKRQLVVLDK